MLQLLRELDYAFGLRCYPRLRCRRYRQILSRFHTRIYSSKVDVEAPCDVPIIGFSATFSRHDGLALGSVFEKIVYHRDVLEMIKEQW